MSAITNSIRELEAKRRSIDAAIKTLRALDRGVGSTSRGSSRNMSEEGRSRIAEAQRKRWAKVRAAAKKGQ